LPNGVRTRRALILAAVIAGCGGGQSQTLDGGASDFGGPSCKAGNLAFAAAVDYAAGTAPRSIALGDLNGDGKLDLTVANGTSNNVSVLLNTSM
jgi:hypothetical protein